MAKKQDELVGISLRIREPLRHRIEQAASRRGVSMNSEIADRLTRSLDDDDRKGSPTTAALVRAILVEIETAERDTGKSWYKDLETAACAGRLIEQAVRSHHPDPKKTDPSYLQAREALLVAMTNREAIETELSQLGIYVPSGGVLASGSGEWVPPDHDESSNTLETLPVTIERSKLNAEAKRTAQALAQKLPDLNRGYAAAAAQFQKVRSPYLKAESRGHDRARHIEQFRLNNQFRFQHVDETNSKTQIFYDHAASHDFQPYVFHPALITSSGKP